MSRFLATFGSLLFFSFVACCVASALLQVVAWTRHRKTPETPVHPGALWKPEGFFDPIGTYQMRLARRALIVGMVVYLSYGVLMIVSATALKAGS